METPYTVAGIISHMKKNAHKSDFCGLTIVGTKKIDGHKSIELAVPKHNIYDLCVWGTNSKTPIERINLRADDAEEKLAKYI